MSNTSVRRQGGICRGAIVVAVMVALALLFVGCEQTERDNTIRVDIPYQVSNLDPQFATHPTAQMLLLNLFEGLFIQNAEGQILPGVAAGHEVSPDGLTYTFTIRPDALWQDGSRVSAQDFAFAFERMFSPYAPSPFAREFLVISGSSEVMSGSLPTEELGVTVAGNQLIIELNAAYTDFLRLLTHPAALPTNPRAFRESMGRYGLEAEYLLTNGPFTLGRWDNLQIHLIPAEHLPESLRPQIERVVFFIGRTDPVGRFLDGASDIAFIPAERLGELSGQEHLVTAPRVVWALAFNQNIPPWSNSLVRQGFSLSLEREVEERLPLSLAISHTFLPPGLTPLGGMPNLPAGDREEGLRLLRLGLSRIWDTGFSDEIYVFSPAFHAAHLEGLLELSAETLGLNITLMPAEVYEIEGRLESGAFGVMLVPFHAQAGDPAGMLRRFYGSGNAFGYQNPRFDHAFRQAVSIHSSAHAAEYFRMAEEILLEDGAVIPLYLETSAYALSPMLSGVEVFASSGVMLFSGARFYRDG